VSQFNQRQKRVAAALQGPIVVQAGPPTLSTGEGAAAWKREPKSELFLLAAGSFAVNNPSFYETELTRNTRFKNLVVQVAVTDPWWLVSFVGWLRHVGNMRTAPMVAALEGMKAIVDAKLPTSIVQPIDPTMKGPARALVDTALLRADEPGEALAYWLANYGKKLPKPLKRGLADAANRLYKQYALTKYDTPSHDVRFADVIELTHPDPSAPWKSDLFKHAIDRRHGRGKELSFADTPHLDRVMQHNALMDVPVENRRAMLADPAFPGKLAAANMTWEALAGWLQGPMDAAAWNAIIPTMGYMALLRNLRNFDEQGISEERFRYVSDKLCDVDEVARSRQFPFRFYAAHRELSSLRWGPALEKALLLSVGNLPALEGVTRVLVDTSASMSSQPLSKNSTAKVSDVAALFGVALAQRNPGRCKLYGFADGVFEHQVKPGASVLFEARKFTNRTGEVGHGTDIFNAIQQTYKPGDARVIVLSDMQTMGRNPGSQRQRRAYLNSSPMVGDALPATVPLYGFSLGGEEAAVAPWGNPNRIELGGLTDATFKLIPLIESGAKADWPWLQEA